MEELVGPVGPLEEQLAQLRRKEARRRGRVRQEPVKGRAQLGVVHGFDRLPLGLPEARREGRRAEREVRGAHRKLRRVDRGEIVAVRELSHERAGDDLLPPRLSRHEVLHRVLPRAHELEGVEVGGKLLRVLLVIAEPELARAEGAGHVGHAPRLLGAPRAPADDRVSHRGERGSGSHTDRDLDHSNSIYTTGARSCPAPRAAARPSRLARFRRFPRSSRSRGSRRRPPPSRRSRARGLPACAPGSARRARAAAP